MNNKKSLVALILVAIIGIVGLTFAYFSNQTTIENEFTTKEYGTSYEEEFVSPANWLPGDTTEKTVIATNTGQVDQAVRISLTESWTPANEGASLNGWIHADGTKSSHTTENELANDERVAKINFVDPSDWTKVGDYYYYNYKLAPSESTTSLIESVTFNSKTKLDDTCVTTEDNGVRTITCNSSGNDYDHATYKLTINIETVQYNKYNEAWGLNNTVTIANASRPQPTAVQYLTNNVVNSLNAEYDETTKCNMFVFNHEATGQTDTLTDYRYIGDSPCNYVKFNCDNDGNNCEIWRIVGVFNVERPDPNNNTQNISEQRIKLVRGNVLPDENNWDGVGPGSDEGENDWSNATLNDFLNGDYYNRLGDALIKQYGLKESARNMIDDAKFYLGGSSYDTSNSYGSTEDMYSWERGTKVYTGRPTEWIGKVALMYPSDYGYTYALNVDNLCYFTPDNCSKYELWDDEIEKVNNIGYPTKSWIYNSNITDDSSVIENIYLLSSNLDRFNHILIIRNIGNIGKTYTYEKYGIRPTLYLSSSVKLKSGDGSSRNPYELSL